MTDFVAAAMLAREPCVACRPGSPPVEAEAAKEMLALLPNWRIEELEGRKRLTRAFTARNFAAALALANRIAELAEAADHHPLLAVEWGQLTVQWWTHAIGGLHRNDFIMAARCDRLAREGSSIDG